MTGNRFIFVDFDGPLLPGKMHLFNSNRKVVEALKRGELEVPMFDPVAVQMHNLWAKYGNAKVVFSTSWARWVRNWEDTGPYLKRVMRYNGYLGDFAEECVTPKRISSEHIHEIQEWCYDYLKPEDKFIAVDDANLSFLEHERCNWKNQGKWIKCSYSDGLTYQNFKEGCEFLGVDNERLLFEEFGIEPVSAEERAKNEELLKKFAYAFI